MRVGLVQMRGGVDPADNVAAAEALITRAAEDGADLVVTPEATNIVQRDGAALSAAVVPLDEDPATAALAALARRLGVWLALGSVMVRSSDGRVANRTVVIAPDGSWAATYDKIHLFNVALGAGEVYRESDTVRPGDQAVVVDAAGARLGLSICYDVRFPALYHALATAGANVMLVSAAFTRPTGRAHWETMLRARAIETGAYVLAPAQGGRHEDGRATWGRSTVVGPWGDVVGVLDHDEPGVLTADLDLSAVADARRRLPQLGHTRAFAPPAGRDAAE